MPLGKGLSGGDCVVAQDVDIKRQGAASAYAFVQYTDISSVVQALREMEGEHIGANKIKVSCFTSHFACVTSYRTQIEVQFAWIVFLGFFWVGGGGGEQKP